MSYSLIPESAPFNEEQRAWLNGFLAGWTGAMGDAAEGEAVAAQLGGGTAVLEAPAEEEEDEDFPWHDPGLAIDERMDLADGKPMKRRMMAAMAQLNCGACGYLCQTYSEAIASGEESNLTLCSPGGKETAEMLKKLAKEAAADDSGEGAAAANGHAANGAAETNGAAKPAGYTRANPFTAAVVSCDNLNGEGSKKQTTHAVINLGDGDLAAQGLDYVVGDSLGVFPHNCPELVDELLDHVGAKEDDVLREQLINQYNLRDVEDELLERLAELATDPGEAEAVRSLIDSDELDSMDVLDVLRKAPSAKIGAAEFAGFLTEIAPRLYSIASSLKAHPGEVHLTVGKATTKVGDRVHKGVASTMFADRLLPGAPLKVYVHRSHGFTVPADPNAPMVMVGPGTGIAPFRAFLEERQATSAPGDNWLFFGDQHEATDFLYREQLDAMAADGLPLRLSTAFSRDQDEKVYVQDRMREHGAELFKWLEQGGYFFVCGDAKRMAADVDKALHAVVGEHGGLSWFDSKQYVEKLKTEGRYVRDVY
ncbi:MAG: sulfite reductase subunit alpha [Planctomycetota bacterium]